MKIAFNVVVILHGLIHFLGFIKAFGLFKIDGLSQPISKKVGIAWMASGISFFIYLILFLLKINLAWIAGFIVVALSQVLIIMYWKDAKFGTIPNTIILLVVIFSFGRYDFQNQIKHETSLLISKNELSDEQIVDEADIKGLPAPISRWLQNVGMVGKAYIQLGKVDQNAKMQLKPDHDQWIDAQAQQYSFIKKPAFIWTTNAKMYSWLNFHGRDKFEDGIGEMTIKINSLVPLVKAKGEKIDEASLQRFLAEIVWFPSFALSEFIFWEAVDKNQAKATLTCEGIKVSGVFEFTDNGDFNRFSTLRYFGNEKEAKMYEWIIEAEDYKSFEGIKVPSKISATWRLEDGDWTWLKSEVTALNFNQNAIK